MKIAIITDTHAGVRGDNRALKAKQSQFFEEVFFPYIDEHNITQLIHLGDLFDRRKYVNFETLAWWNRVFMDRLNERNISCDFIAGNHDTYYKSTNSVNSLRELYSASNYETMRFYWEEPVVREYDGLEICLVPWIAPDNEVSSMKALENTKAKVVMGHFEIENFQMQKGHFCEHGLSVDLFSRFYSVFSGHFHKKSSQRNITYLGAPYQMTWNDENEFKGFHVFDTETLELTPIENPFRSFHKLKYQDSDLTAADLSELDFSGVENAFVKVVVINKSNPYLFDLFIEKISQSGPADIKIVDDNKNMDLLQESDLIDETESTEVILEKYIESIETEDSVDKERLKKFMHSLYLEAMEL
jgi:DNA repair exonuclease SbcCD nuclease subunit